MRLVIFDIDGTLLLNGPITGRLFAESFTEVVGHEPVRSDVKFHGNTDRGIFRALLDGDDDAYEAHFGAFAAAFTRMMRAHYDDADGPHLLPGARALVEALDARDDVALAVGTGNIRETAYVKLRRFGLDGHFPVGGFGGDHLLRSHLIRGALEEARAHYDTDFDPATTWVIGDTIHDVEAAHAVGCRVMAVMTGPDGRAELEPADVLVEDLCDTRARVRQLVDERTP